MIIPLAFKFGTTTISANALACGDTMSSVNRIKKSPIFNNFPFVEGTTNVGTTQYIDAFQRANFWQSVGSVTPNYHTLLSPVTTKTLQTIVVPPSAGVTVGPFCGTQKIGEVDINFVDAQLQALITKLKIPATSLPLFINYDVFETNGGFCILGYHSATVTNQTYAIATYNDAGLFSKPIQDIHALSHELGEWMDDPFGNNIVPTWGKYGSSVGMPNEPGSRRPGYWNSLYRYTEWFHVPPRRPGLLLVVRAPDSVHCCKRLVLVPEYVTDPVGTLSINWVGPGTKLGLRCLAALVLFCLFHELKGEDFSSPQSLPRVVTYAAAL